MIRGLRPVLGCSYWGAVDREPTEVRLLWDERFLYIAFSCTDRDIVADPGLKRDGDVYEADACEFFLDVSGEGKEWFELQVSPLNQVMDTVSSFTGGPGGCTDTLRIRPELLETAYRTTRAWNAAGLRSAAGKLVCGGRVIGWTVEFAFPAAAVNLTAWKPGGLRMNFVRYNHGFTTADAEKRFSCWSPVQHGCPHISPAAMGRVFLKERLLVR